MRVAILLFVLVLQLFAYVGPICGDHLTAAESMDCCKKGHIDATTAVTENSAASCCGSCDFSKAQVIRRQELNLSALHFVAPVSFDPVITTEPTSDFTFFNFHKRKDSLSDPPEVFLLVESFRI